MDNINTAAQLVSAALGAAKEHKTLYVHGCWGAPMNPGNQQRYINALSFNRKADRKKKIQEATGNVFGFDCSGLIKGLLWGWEADTGHVYGGAGYACNGVSDINADQMIAQCKDVSTDFTAIVPGEVVWIKGHIGIYVGDGLAVECTYRWNDGVQITAVHNLGEKCGYNGRRWTKHGKLPWITYDAPQEAAPQAAVKVDPAKSFTQALAGSYFVDSLIGLKLRAGASTAKPILEVMPHGGKFRCYGYHTGNWLYGISASGKKGFCHKSYLRK